MKKLFLSLGFSFFAILQTFGQEAIFSPVLPGLNTSRSVAPFDSGWAFHFLYDIRREHQQVVNLPHTWNAQDVLQGKENYQRTTGIYEKDFFAPSSMKGKRVFLYFYGANSVAYVFINKRLVGKHSGGYTAFCFEITGNLKWDALNTISVQVSNAYNPDVPPLFADFNIYGGIHRPVSMIITEPNCISPLDYASTGVYLTQKKVSEQSADIEIKTILSLENKEKKLEVRSSIFDGNEKLLLTQSTKVTGNDSIITQNIFLLQPHLWNGVTDPYLYSAKIELVQDGSVVDAITQHMGLRYFRVSADSGFFLNGKYLDLHGFGFHEDKAGIGSAYRKADYEMDMSLIRDAGANALRFTHYPHGNPMYDLCDQYGIAVWTEIPFVGSFTNSTQFKLNTINMLKELIRQHYNYPSIFFWGLENEIHIDGDDPVPFLHQLDSIAHLEDNTRYTTLATDIQAPAINNITNLVAYNKYFGWYDGKVSGLGTWADKTHGENRGKPVAISEFGAGASVYQHEHDPQSVLPFSKFHPEEWQTKLHEESWEILKSRPFIWAKFVWNLSDFGSAIRNEGYSKGINDKGLVTYDKQVKKDAFYFYKVNWNPEPMIYITEKRFDVRNDSVTGIKIYTNLGQAELFVNGNSQGVKNADDLKRVEWKNIQLQTGMNKIFVKAKAGNNIYTDSCEWLLKK